MGPQRETFFNYQFSTTMTIDILAATDFHKKERVKIFPYKAQSPKWIPTKNAFDIHLKKLITL